MEHTLVSFCNGDVDKANGALARVASFSRGRLVKLVRAGHAAMKTHRNPSLNQLAALVYDLTAGVGVVTVELERRQAKRANRMQ